MEGSSKQSVRSTACFELISKTQRCTDGTCSSNSATRWHQCCGQLSLTLTLHLLLVNTRAAKPLSCPWWRTSCSYTTITQLAASIPISHSFHQKQAVVHTTLAGWYRQPGGKGRRQSWYPQCIFRQTGFPVGTQWRTSTNRCSAYYRGQPTTCVLHNFSLVCGARPVCAECSKSTRLWRHSNTSPRYS